jgi:hypothetical protein
MRFDRTRRFDNNARPLIFYYNYSSLQCPPCNKPNFTDPTPPIKTSSRSNLQNRRSSHNRPIINALRTVAKHQITLTINTRSRDLYTEINPITSLSKVSKNRAASSDESSVKLRRIGARQDRASSLDRNGRPSDHRASGRRGNSWVGFDRERRVIGRAGLDERRRERVHGVRRKRDILRRRERAEFVPRRRRAQVRRVARLNSQYRPGNGQVVFIRDLASGAEVSADSYAFEDAGDAEELCDRRHGEAVDAFFRGGGAERGGEEVDMGLLVAGDLGQACVGGC